MVTDQLISDCIDRGEQITQLLTNLLQFFLSRDPAGTWIEHLTPDDKPKGNRIPSSTLYHLFMAFAELDRLLGSS
jgi:mannose/cellobiose epimerase-like protein (N-acyl-D-glucosamine 2-epimerase family)